MMTRHPLRVTGRFLWFVGVVLVAVFDFLFRCAFRPENSAPTARALWLQRHSRRVLKIFNMEAQVSGAVPTRGLLVSNHLGYLDIFVLASLAPVVFVSKSEIKFWPVVGWLTQMGGTLFVDRERRVQVGQVNDEIQAALKSKVQSLENDVNWQLLKYFYCILYTRTFSDYFKPRPPQETERCFLVRKWQSSINQIRALRSVICQPLIY